jgi:chitinase
MKRSVRASLWAAAALAIVAATIPATGALSAGSVTAQFVLASDWGTGYEGHYSSVTISLAWNASTDNRGVTGYDVIHGIDIDWEWPGSEGNVGNVIRPEDKANLTALLAEFRSQLDAYGATIGKHFDLSIFLPADPAKMDAGFEGNRIFQYLDYAAVQGYDLHGAWENQTNHQSNLFSPTADPAPIKFSGDIAISAWLSRGGPAKKLALGVPAYGRGWQGVQAGPDNGLWQVSNGAAPGRWEAGIQDYKLLKGQAGARFRDTTNGAYWLYDDNVFWSYDDPTLIQAKGTYVKNRGLGGLMMWSLDGDDGSLVTAISNGLQ